MGNDLTGSTNTGIADPLGNDTYIAYRRRRAWIRFGGASVAFIVLLGFSVVLARGIGRANALAPSPLLGRNAPSFDLARLDTGRLSNTALSNTVYVVNFWASWCVPCREEADTLQAFAARHTTGDVVLVGVLFADDLSHARAFVNEFKLTYPQLQDPTGRTAVDYGVRGVPETFVVDQRGVVMASLIGALSPGTLDRVVEAVNTGQTVTARNSRYRSR